MNHRHRAWHRLAALGRPAMPALMATWLLGLPSLASADVPVNALFRAGASAYHAGDYGVSASEFRQAAGLRPASGTLQNLGNAEWLCGQPGPAVLAWEQALWLDPFNGQARENLRFARKTAQLETPDLAWYEVVSTWLPVNWWPWISWISLWLAAAMVGLPGLLRFPKAAWHQALAALGFAVLLLTLPAHVGIETRLRLGFVLQKDTALRLTPTTEGEPISRLAAGEPARLERARGNYLLVRTSHARGWVRRDEFGLLSSPPPSPAPAAPPSPGDGLASS